MLAQFMVAASVAANLYGGVISLLVGQPERALSCLGAGLAVLLADRWTARAIGEKP